MEKNLIKGVPDPVIFLDPDQVWKKSRIQIQIKIRVFRRCWIQIRYG